MTDSTREGRLPELLERYADELPVGPPPLARITAARRARKVRRRRLVAAAVGGVAAAAALPVLLLTGGERPTQPPAPAEPGAEVIASPGHQLYGTGRVVVEVPDDWGFNDLHCNNPAGDTVVLDHRDYGPLCYRARGPGVESLTLLPYDAEALGVTHAVTIDGVEAKVEKVSCPDGVDAVCGARLGFPSLDVIVHAESNTDAATVEELLGRVRVANNVAGVPWADSKSSSGATTDAVLRGYLDTLTDLGLAVRTDPVPNLTTGRLKGVVPHAGTVLAPGAEVVVHVDTGPDAGLGGPRPKLVLAEESEMGGLAIVSGAVNVRENGCVTIGDQPAVLPAGTTVAEGGSGLVLPDGTTIGFGDTVDGSGGYVPARTYPALLENGCAKPQDEVASLDAWNP